MNPRRRRRCAESGIDERDRRHGRARRACRAARPVAEHTTCVLAADRPPRRDAGRAGRSSARPIRWGCCAGRSPRPRRARCGSTRGGRLVRAPSVGFAKDLEGPTSRRLTRRRRRVPRRCAPTGSATTPRHIHWMSTARTGTLMVRHYVDNRRPHLGVLLDDDRRRYARRRVRGRRRDRRLARGVVDAAQLPVTARVGRTVAARPGAAPATTTPCSSADDVPALHGACVLVARRADTLRAEPATSALAIVTARRRTDELLRLRRPRPRRARRDHRHRGRRCGRRAAGVARRPRAARPQPRRVPRRLGPAVA